MYPLTTDYIPSISRFIEYLNESGEITALTNTMSTQVFGEYETVMRILQEAMKRTMTEEPKVIFVTKFINADLTPKNV